MKIEIELSENNEGTFAPWWCIIDPHCVLSLADGSGANSISGMITGPFFSRESAQKELNRSRYNYGVHAVVYCMSGYHSDEYRVAIECAKGAKQPL